MNWATEIKKILYKLQELSPDYKTVRYDQFFNVVCKKFPPSPYKIYEVTSIGGGHNIKKKSKKKRREFDFTFNPKHQTFSISVCKSYFIDNTKLSIVLNIHFLFQIIFNVIKHQMRAENIAFALLWYSKTSSQKEMIFKLWKELHAPSYYISPYVKVSLSDFVISLEKSGFQTYFEDFTMRFFEYGATKKEDTEVPHFEYRCLKFPMRHFSPNTMKVFKNALAGSGLKIKDVRERSSLSRQTVSTSLKKLISSFMLIPGTYFSAEKLGLSSTFLIFKTKFSTKISGTDLQFPGLVSFNILSSFDNVHIINFLLPNTESHKNNLQIWWSKLITSLKKNRVENLNKPTFEIGIKDFPILGIELSEYRFLSEKPELYDPKINEWNFASPVESWKTTTESPKIELNSTKRKIILEMLKGNKNPKKIRTKVKCNQKTLYSYIKEFENKKISYLIYQMGDLTNVHKIAIIFPATLQQYEIFVSKFGSRLPFCKSTLLSVSNEKPPHANFIAIAYIGIPRTKIWGFMNSLKQHFAYQSSPYTREFVPIFQNLNVRGNSWHTGSLPDIQFVWNHENY